MRPGRREGLLVLAAVGVFLSGCGNAEPPAGITPLSARLDQIDQSLVAQHFTQARHDLTALANETREALAAGDLDEAEAQRILAAITVLRATLPALPTPTPTTSPTLKRSDQQSNRPDKNNGHGKRKKPKR